MGDLVQYFLYREYSDYRHELIDLAESEDQARSLACAHSRIGQLIVSVRKCTPTRGAPLPICAFRRGRPYIAVEQ